MQAKSPLTRRGLFLARVRGTCNLLGQILMYQYRSKGIHVLPAICVLIESLFLLLGPVSQDDDRELFGYLFLLVFTGLNFFLILLLGTLAFGGVLEVQKERGTLGLLKLTGLGPTGIVLGMFGSVAMEIGLFLLLQVPLLVLVNYFEGASLRQLFAIVSTLVATSFVLGSLSMYTAVITDDSAKAMMLMIWRMIEVVLIYALFLLVSLLPDAYPSHPMLDGVAGVCKQVAEFLKDLSPHTQFLNVAQPGFTGFPSFRYLAVCFLVGSLLLRLSIKHFERNTSQIEPRSPAEKLRRSRERAAHSKQPRVSLLCWDDPFLWREFQLKSGGWKNVASRTRTAFLVVGFAYILILALFGSSQKFAAEMMSGVVANLQLLLNLWATLSGIVAASILLQEIGSKTMGLLLIAGRPPSAVCRRMIVARMWANLSYAPLPILAYIGVLWMCLSNPVPKELVILVGLIPFECVVSFYAGLLWILLIMRVSYMRSTSIKVMALLVSTGIWTMSVVGSTVSCLAIADFPLRDSPDLFSNYVMGFFLVLAVYIATLPLVPLVWRGIIVGIQERMGEG